MMILGDNLQILSVTGLKASFPGQYSRHKMGFVPEKLAPLTSNPEGLNPKPGSNAL